MGTDQSGGTTSGNTSQNRGSDWGWLGLLGLVGLFGLRRKHEETVHHRDHREPGMAR
jgi:MYXO-CTERM domain-containing protein